MSDFNSFDFTVDERAEGKRKLVKVLGRTGLLVIVFGFFITCLAVKLYPLAILPLLLLGLVMFFWKTFNCELKYAIEGGIISFFRIYGGKKPKKILSVTIKDFREVAPRTAESDADLKSKGVTKAYSFSSHSTAPDQYYATFEENGNLCVVYFEATEKTLKLLRYYNPVTVVTKVSR